MEKSIHRFRDVVALLSRGSIFFLSRQFIQGLVHHPHDLSCNFFLSKIKYCYNHYNYFCFCDVPSQASPVFTNGNIKFMTFNIVSLDHGVFSGVI